MSHPLTSLTSGMPIVFGGNRVVEVDDALAAAFRDGDRLVVLQDSGDLLHIPAEDWASAASAVGAAAGAFSAMGAVDDDQIKSFFLAFARRLEDDAMFAPILEANQRDVTVAREKGRSTTRLVLSDRMRTDMIEGLGIWASTETNRGSVIDRVVHDGWSLDQVRSGLGVVGFVFEGRPNVFADATGLLASGNTIAFRIGSDALGTARAIMDHALIPALVETGLPEGAVSLVDSPSRAAGWALFSDRRLGLAVARGSGQAVSQLGAAARQAGVPVSLHGTGGAWIVASESADAGAFSAAVYHSLDRKVCNTVNTVCIVSSRAGDLVPVFLDALERAGKRLDSTSRLHVTESARRHLPDAWSAEAVLLEEEDLGTEWEWETTPEVSLTVVPDVNRAVELFNLYSPRFAASLVSEDDDEQSRFFELIDSPFVGNGFTRWVDGQFAFDRPELGLSNWQFGRLLGRGGVLSGDSVYTIRVRARQTDPEIHR